MKRRASGNGKSKRLREFHLAKGGTRRRQTASAKSSRSRGVKDERAKLRAIELRFPLAVACHL